MGLKELGINMRNWVDSAKDRDYWRGLVSVTLNLCVHKSWSQYLLQVNGINSEISNYESFIINYYGSKYSLDTVYIHYKRNGTL